MWRQWQALTRCASECFLSSMIKPYKKDKNTTEKEKFKYFTLFSNIAQFRRIFHGILLFPQGQWRQSQKCWSHRNLSQHFHAERLHFSISKHLPSNNYKLAFQMHMMGHMAQWNHTVLKFYPLHHFHKRLSHVLQSTITESSFKFQSKRVAISHLLTKCKKQKNEKASKANKTRNCLCHSSIKSL